MSTRPWLPRLTFNAGVLTVTLDGVTYTPDPSGYWLIKGIHDGAAPGLPVSAKLLAKRLGTTPAELSHHRDALPPALREAVVCGDGGYRILLPDPGDTDGD